MRGRKPYSGKQHDLNGNPSHKPLADLRSDAQGVGSVGAAPDWFDKEQREAWNHTIAVAPIHVLTGTDRQLLVTWCCAVVDHKRATIDIQKRGLLVKGEGTRPIQNPSVRTANHASGIIMRALAEMGFSPSARARLEIPGGTGDGTGFDEFNDQPGDVAQGHKKAAH